VCLSLIVCGNIRLAINFFLSNIIIAFVSNTIDMESVLFRDGVGRFGEDGTSITRQHKHKAPSYSQANSGEDSIGLNPDNKIDASIEGIHFIINNEVENCYLLTWNGLDDPKKPFNWPTIRKVGVLATVSLLTLSE
jgi:hypothetical protein